MQINCRKNAAKMQIIPIKRSYKSRARDTKAGLNPEERKKENARGVGSGVGELRDELLLFSQKYALAI